MEIYGILENITSNLDRSGEFIVATLGAGMNDLQTRPVAR